MEISNLAEEAARVANDYRLTLIEVDRTNNTISLRLMVDADLFIQIYANALKNKTVLALVFKNRRLYGYDSEGGRYHCHPLDNPEGHTFSNERKEIRDFVQESMRFLEEKNLL